MRISDTELDELLEKKSARRVIGLHCSIKINLTGKQLTRVLKIKNGGVK